MSNEEKASTPVELKPKISLAIQMARQNISYFCDAEMPDWSTLTSAINIFMRKSGVWQLRKNKVGYFLVQQSVAADKSPILGFPDEKLEEGFLVNYGLIPYENLAEIVSFFKDICNSDQNEVYAQIFWDPINNRYFNHVPKQRVSKASVHFDRNQELEAANVLVLEIHSHNTMAAYFSSTDDGDEKSDRLFGVVGHLDKNEPAMEFSFVCAGKRVKVRADQIFSQPVRERYPEDWKANVSTGPAATANLVSSGYASQSQSWQSYQGYQAGGGKGWSPSTKYSYGYGYGEFDDSDEAKPGTDRRNSIIVPAYRSSAVVKTQSEIEKEVEEAATAAIETLDAKMVGRNFLDDKISIEDIDAAISSPGGGKSEATLTALGGDKKKLSLISTNNPRVIVRSATKVEPEVSTKQPFFHEPASKGSRTDTGSHEVDADMAVWQKAEELKIYDEKFEMVIKRTVEAISDGNGLSGTGGDMDIDSKKKLFQDMLAFYTEEDVEILLEEIANMGHQAAMVKAIEPDLSDLLEKLRKIEAEEIFSGDLESGTP